MQQNRGEQQRWPRRQQYDGGFQIDRAPLNGNGVMNNGGRGGGHNNSNNGGGRYHRGNGNYNHQTVVNGNNRDGRSAGESRGNNGNRFASVGEPREQPENKRLQLPYLWRPEFSKQPAELKDLGNEMVQISPPYHLKNKNYEYDQLLHQDCQLFPYLSQSWINDLFPESIRQSAVIHVTFSSNNKGVRLSFQFRLSVEEIRYMIETQTPTQQYGQLQGILTALELKMAEDRKVWYVPTFRRFPREIFDMTHRYFDPLLTIISYESRGFLIPEYGKMTSARVIDYSYTGDYLYYFNQHSEWNQIFIPEFVCMSTCGTKPLYRFKMSINQEKFFHLSSTKTLYLEVVNIEKFICGAASSIRMTCDISRASTFIIKSQIHGGAIRSETATDNTHPYYLYLCTVSGSEYPLYLSRSEVFEHQSHLSDSYEFAKFIRKHRSLESGNAAIAESEAIVEAENVNDVDDDRENREDDEEDMILTQEVDLHTDVLLNICRMIETINSPVEDPELARFLSPESRLEYLLFHPMASSIGIRNMSVQEAFRFAVRLYRYLKVPGKEFHFVTRIRNGPSRENYQYGIGCNSNGTPTFLNKVLVFSDAATLQEWSGITLQIQLDNKSYLRLLPNFEVRYGWIKRAFHESLPKDMVADNMDHQKAMTSEILEDIDDLVQNNNDCQSNQVFKALQSTERRLLKKRNIKSFSDLHIRETSFLEFALTNERKFNDMFRFNRTDPARDGFYQGVESIGIRLLKDLEEVGESEVTWSEQFVVMNILSYFGVHHAVELGYASDGDLFQAVLERRRSYGSEVYDSLTALRGKCLVDNALSHNAEEEEVLMALRACPVLGNLFEESNWDILFQEEFGAMLEFLRGHSNSIGFVEIAHNYILRLPDIDEVTMGSKRAAYSSILSSNSMFSDELMARTFIGALIGLWNERVSIADITSIVSPLFRSLSESKSPAEMFQVVVRCIELIPQKLALDIGEIVVISTIQKSWLRELDSSHLFACSCPTRLVLVRIARKVSNDDLMMLLQYNSRTPLAAASSAERNLPNVALPNPWASNESFVAPISELEQTHDVSPESVDNDRSADLLKICKELASTRSLTLSDEQDKYIAIPGCEGLHETTRDAVMILAQQLYTHQGRSLFELIQNADDCDYSEGNIPYLDIQLRADHSCLRLAYNETGFEEANIRAISKINASTKVHSLNQGGKKGIGFKSVFMISEEPEVHSKGFHFKFNEHGEMGYLSPIPLSVDSVHSSIANLSRQGTVLLLPLRRSMVSVPGSFEQIAEFTESFASSDHKEDNAVQVQAKMHTLLREQLSGITSDAILFLRRLRIFTMDCDATIDSTSSESSMKFERQDQGFLRSIREISHSGAVKDIKWWVLGDEASSSSALIVPKNPLQVAIALHETASSNVSALLPIRSYGLPFALNGPFQLTANREDIIKAYDSELNHRLILKVPSVFMNAVRNVLTLVTSQSSKPQIHSCCAAIVRAIPTVREVASDFKDVATTIVNQMRAVHCLPAIVPSREEREELYTPTSLPQPTGHWHRYGEVCAIAPTNAILLPPAWREFFRLADLAHALSAPGQAVKYLADPDFPINSTVSKALDIPTLNVDILKNAIIHLWNNRVVFRQSSTTVNNGAVFKRLMTGLFNIVSASRHTALLTELYSRLQVIELPEGRLVTLDRSAGCFIPFVFVKLMKSAGCDVIEFIQFAKTAMNKIIIDPTISEFIEEIFLTSGKLPFYPHPRFVSELLQQWSSGRHTADSSVKKAQIQLVVFVWKLIQVLPSLNNESLPAEGPNIVELVASMNAIMSDVRYLRLLKEAVEVYFPPSFDPSENSAGDMFANVRLVPPGGSTQVTNNLVVLNEFYPILVAVLSSTNHEEEMDYSQEDVAIESTKNVEDSVLQRLNRVSVSCNATTIGRLGELYMFRQLRHLFAESAGYRVVWENEHDECGLPYDFSIHSTISGQLHARVEVKTTSHQRSHPQSQVFEISINESGEMTKEKSKYYIARVYGASSATGNFHDFDLIEDPYYKLNDHSWKLVCKMSRNEEDLEEDH